MRHSLFLFALVGAFGVGLLHGQAQPANDESTKYESLSKPLYADVDRAVHALRSEDINERKAAYFALLDAHEELLYRLRRLAGEKPANIGIYHPMDAATREKLDRMRRVEGVRITANLESYNTREVVVELLGRLNDSKALRLLVQNIEFRDAGILGGVDPF